MYGKTKLSKRQIKEDRFTVFMLTAKSQLQEYWQYVAIGVAAVVLIIVGVVYYVNSLESRELEASARFSEALQNYGTGQAQVAIMGLNQIVQDYGSSKVAEESTFLLGNINLLTRNYPEAVRYYELYLATYRDNVLNRSAALAGIATCLENQGQFIAAAAKFVEAIEEYPEGPMDVDYRMAVVRNSLAAGDVSQAREQLEYIQENYQGTQIANQAQLLFYEKAQP